MAIRASSTVAAAALRTKVEPVAMALRAEKPTPAEVRSAEAAVLEATCAMVPAAARSAGRAVLGEVVPEATASGGVAHKALLAEVLPEAILAETALEAAILTETPLEAVLGAMQRGRRAATMASQAGASRLSPYATPSATREVLERHGLYTKYALGQNFLVNDDVVKRIVELAELSLEDRVLEVGPGIGTLTSALLQCAGHVASVEMDHDLPAVLRDTLAPWLGSFTLFEMDALDLCKEHLAQALGTTCGMPNKLVSNLPYAVAATIVLDYLQRFEFLESATVMVQKEVADRMMAKPGTKAYGAYTVKLSLVARPAGRFSVAPGNFFPPPHVESAVIRLDRVIACDASGRELTPEELRAASTMADAAFATRRKTLANSCKTYFSGQPDVLAALPDLFTRADIDPRRRGETLDRAEFIRLGQALLVAI